MKEKFADFARYTATAMASPITFTVAVGTVVVWAIAGPFFGFSEAWQLVINTGTTIVTFLMVFLIQNSQNRDMKAMHVKLDELVKSIGNARNKIILAEKMPTCELDRLDKEFARENGAELEQPDEKEDGGRTASQTEENKASSSSEKKKSG